MSLRNLIGSSDIAQKEWTVTEGNLVSYFGEMVYSSDRQLWLSAGENGIVGVSTDGYNWSYRALPISNDVTSVLWVGTRALATTIDGSIFTSEDTVTWTQRRVGGNYSRGEIYDTATNGAGVVVAIGNAGIYLSTDSGSTWSNSSASFGSYIPLGNSFPSITWNGSLFVALTLGGLITSPNGTSSSWTYRQTNDNCHSIAYSPSLNMFVACGNRVIQRSTDGGNTWVSVLDPYIWYGVYWDQTQSRFIVVGQDGIKISQDGINWSVLDSLPGSNKDAYDIVSNGTTYVVVGTSTTGAGYIASGTSISSGSNTLVQRTVPSTNTNLEACIWDGTNFIAVGTSSNSTILKSSDGITWTTSSFYSGSYYDIQYNGSMYVIVGQSGRIYTSTDGTTWTQRTSGTTQTLNSVVWTGSQWMIGTAYGDVLTSSDGITWTSRYSSTVNIRAIATSGTTHVSVGYYGEIAKSTDGINWVSRGVGGIGWGAHYDATSGYTFGGDANRYGILRSSDGLVWDRIMPTFGASYDVPFKFTRSGSYLFALGEADGLVFSSSDNGTTWSVVDTWTSGGSIYTRGLTYAIGGYNLYAVDKNWYSISYDANAWNSSDSDVRYQSVTYAKELNIYVAKNQYGLYTSRDGINWSYRLSHTASYNGGAVAWNGSLFVYVLGGGKAYTSSNGINWTLQTTGTTKDLYDVIWNGSLWIACGGGVILTSPDGINWTIRLNISNASVTFNRISWNEQTGIGIAAGSGYAISADSTGVSWVLRSVPNLLCVGSNIADGKWVVGATYGSSLISTNIASNKGFSHDTIGAGQSQPINDIIWTGTQFVAVGGNGLIKTSTTGSSWTDRSTGSTYYQGVAQLGSTLAVVGSGGTVLTSSDSGVTWTSRTSNTTSYLYDIAAGPSLFVAVGDSRIITSPDGITWTVRSASGISGTHYIYDVVWTGTKYITVGGQIITSSDGTTWSALGTNPVPSNALLYGVASNGTITVAVGTSATGGPFILTSADGTTWTDRSSNITPLITAGYLSSVHWDGSRFIAVGTLGIITSSDGINWTIHIKTGYSDVIGLTNGQYNGRICAADSGGLFATYDGTSWTYHSVYGFYTSKLLNVGSSVYAFSSVKSYGGNPASIIKSTDLVNWTVDYSYGIPIRDAALGSRIVAVGDGKLISS